MLACSPSGKQFSDKAPLSSTPSAMHKDFPFIALQTIRRWRCVTRGTVPVCCSVICCRPKPATADRTAARNGGTGSGATCGSLYFCSCGYIEQLGETGRIVGVCEPRYMDLPSIQAGLKSGQIADMGEATAPNVEKMIERKAELVIVSPFQNSGYGPVEKLGIPIVEGADYMESLPLGRTEWIRFYGLLFGKERWQIRFFVRRNSVIWR